MKNSIRPACFFLVFTCALDAQTFKPDIQVGDLQFTMPAGWTRLDRQGATVLIPPGVPSSQNAGLVLFPAAELKTTLREWLDAQWANTRKSYRVIQAGQAASRRTESGLDVYYLSGTVADRAGTNVVMLLAGVQNGTRVEPMLFMSSTPDLLPEQSKGLDVFFNTLHFAKAGSSAPPPPRTNSGTPPPGRIDGIYRSWNIAGVATKQGSGFNFVTFFPDGRYLGKMPDQGMEVDDCAGPSQNLSCGTYTISGNTATVVRPPSQYKREPTVDTFTVCRGGAVLGPSDCHDDKLISMYLLEGGGDDLKLQGTFRRSDYRQQYSPRQGIAFSTDGRFVDEGVLKAALVMHRDARGNYAFDDGIPGRGTYHIGHYTLTLKYTDGRVKRATFYMEPGASKNGVQEFFISTWKFTLAQ